VISGVEGVKVVSGTSLILLV